MHRLFSLHKKMTSYCPARYHHTQELQSIFTLYGSSIPPPPPSSPPSQSSHPYSSSTRVSFTPSINSSNLDHPPSTSPQPPHPSSFLSPNNPTASNTISSTSLPPHCLPNPHFHRYPTLSHQCHKPPSPSRYPTAATCSSTQLPLPPNLPPPNLPSLLKTSFPQRLQRLPPLSSPLKPSSSPAAHTPSNFSTDIIMNPGVRVSPSRCCGREMKFMMFLGLVTILRGSW